MLLLLVLFYIIFIVCIFFISLHIYYILANAGNFRIWKIILVMGSTEKFAMSMIKFKKYEYNNYIVIKDFKGDTNC